MSQNKNQFSYDVIHIDEENTQAVINEIIGRYGREVRCTVKAVRHGFSVSVVRYVNGFMHYDFYSIKFKSNLEREGNATYDDESDSISGESATAESGCRAEET